MMDRMTRKLENGKYAQNFTTGNGFYTCFSDMMQKLGRLEDMQEAGRLIELPCAVGDTVYELQKIRKRIQEYTVTYVNYNNHSLYYGWILKDGKGIYSNLNGFEESTIGRTVFLTLEEAEAALKERESE